MTNHKSGEIQLNNQNSLGIWKTLEGGWSAAYLVHQCATINSRSRCMCCFVQLVY